MAVSAADVQPVAHELCDRIMGTANWCRDRPVVFVEPEHLEHVQHGLARSQSSFGWTSQTIVPV